MPIPPARTMICPECHGQGIILKTESMSVRPRTYLVNCPSCSGTGTIELPNVKTGPNSLEDQIKY